MSSLPPRMPPAQGESHQDTAGKRIDSQALLDSRGELIIEHRGKRYQLRETRNGKLILTS
ncbi:MULTISPECIES: hemin uptake protein HemP [Halomonadaceae]|uniref:hemin uptake protein HemP n=1 Tax=Halomonadaceae TaxID=28256 RepID=UPI001599906C|nr:MULTISPECIES: hemin uptake protein HemP [Halomonas]QJQ95240.1 hemin uptake protein HemP [Halomonas sp. PA5]